MRHRHGQLHVNPHHVKTYLVDSAYRIDPIEVNLMIYLTPPQRVFMLILIKQTLLHHHRIRIDERLHHCNLDMVYPIYHASKHVRWITL